MYIMQQLGLSVELSAAGGMAIRQAMAMAGIPAESGGLRITAQPHEHGCKYLFSIEQDARETDYIVRQHGIKMYVDPFSAEHVNGSEIDFAETEEGARFTLTPPDRSKYRKAPLVA
jgi:iron-sulfur cluster assembly accessory protein